jgi:hypothetical protein
MGKIIKDGEPFYYYFKEKIFLKINLRKLLKLLTFLLMVMIFVTACNSNIENEDNGLPINYEDNELEGTVAYRRPCKEAKPLLRSHPQGIAYLFKDFIPEGIEELYKPIDTTSNVAYWIVFDSKANRVVLYGFDGFWWSAGDVCNFPDFAKAWDIPENGCKVYFEGIAYESCTPKGGIPMSYSYDFVLTILKRE